MLNVVGDYHNPCPYKEDAEKWNKIGTFNTPEEIRKIIITNHKDHNCFVNNEIVEHIEKRIKEIRHQLDHTNPDYKRSIALQEHLQEMVNLIGFEKYEEIMVGKK